MGPAPHYAAQARQRDNSPLSPISVLARNTGLGLPAKVFRDRVHRDTFMRDCDNLMAEKLHANGFKVFQDRQLAWVGDVTERQVNLSRLRDLNIFETVQQRHRSHYLKALEHFGENCPGRKYFRYAVITSERRLKVGENIRAFKARMMARIAAWQRHIREAWDIEVLLTVVEYTFDEDTRSIFVHFNVLMWPHRNLAATDHFESLDVIENGMRRTVRTPVSQWQMYLKFSWKFLKVHWKDNAKVEKFGELMKYVLKGVDRRALDQVETVWLFQELFHQRFIVAYGAFKGHLRGLRENRLKLAYVSDPGETKKRIRLVQLPDLPEKTDDLETVCDDDDSDKPTSTDENVIRGRTGCLNGATAWAEPGTLVENYTATPVTPGGQRRLNDLRAKAATSAEWWKLNGAPDPAIAIAVSDAWLLAPDDQAAEKVLPLFFGLRGAKNDSNADILSAQTKVELSQDLASESMVHTTDLTLHQKTAEIDALDDFGGSDPPAPFVWTRKPYQRPSGIPLTLKNLDFGKWNGLSQVIVWDIELEYSVCSMEADWYSAEPCPRPLALLVCDDDFEVLDRVDLPAGSMLPAEIMDAETGELHEFLMLFATLPDEEELEEGKNID
jgi:hypothetical protein